MSRSLLWATQAQSPLRKDLPLEHDALEPGSLARRRLVGTLVPMRGIRLTFTFQPDQSTQSRRRFPDA